MDTKMRLTRYLSEIIQGAKHWIIGDSLLCQTSRYFFVNLWLICMSL